MQRCVVRRYVKQKVYIPFEAGHAEGDALHIQLGSSFIRAPTHFRLLYPVVFLSLPFLHSPRMSRLHKAIESYMLLPFILDMPAYCHAFAFPIALVFALFIPRVGERPI